MLANAQERRGSNRPFAALRDVARTHQRLEMHFAEDRLLPLICAEAASCLLSKIVVVSPFSNASSHCESAAGMAPVKRSMAAVVVSAFACSRDLLSHDTLGAVSPTSSGRAVCSWSCYGHRVVPMICLRALRLEAPLAMADDNPRPFPSEHTSFPLLSLRTPIPTLLPAQKPQHTRRLPTGRLLIRRRHHPLARVGHVTPATLLIQDNLHPTAHRRTPSGTSRSMRASGSL